MKKILLTTSALAGVVLVAGTAAAEAPTVSFSGSVDYYLRTTDFDAPAGAAPANGPGWDLNAHSPASELVWDVNGTADNGLQFGARVDVRFAGSSVTTDEAWLDFAGNWGRVVIGDDDGVIDSMQVGGQSVLPVGAYDTSRWNGAVALGGNAANGGISATGDVFAGIVGETGDATKIAYYTPSFAGFMGGISITPDSSNSFSASNEARSTGRNGTTVVQQFGDRAHNVTEVSLGYSGTFGDVAVKGSAGYLWGQAVSGNNNVAGSNVTSTANGTNLEDFASWQLGGTVEFAGFGIGLGYNDFGDSGCNLTANPGCDLGDSWNAGLSYNYGAGKVGIGYASHENNANGAAAGDYEADVVSVEGTYVVSQGLTTYAGVAFYDVTDTTRTVAQGQSADSTVFVLGTRVNF